MDATAGYLSDHDHSYVEITESDSFVLVYLDVAIPGGPGGPWSPEGQWRSIRLVIIYTYLKTFYKHLIHRALVCAT